MRVNGRDGKMRSTYKSFAIPREASLPPIPWVNVAFSFNTVGPGISLQNFEGYRSVSHCFFLRRVVSGDVGLGSG